MQPSPFLPLAQLVPLVQLVLPVLLARLVLPVLLVLLGLPVQLEPCKQLSEERLLTKWKSKLYTSSLHLLLLTVWFHKYCH